MNPETLNQIEDYFEANVPFVMTGVPGIGKTSEIEAMIKARGGHYEPLIASGMDPSDFGIPLRENPTGNRVICALPEWAKRCNDAATEGRFVVLFLDEASQTHPAMQAPMLELWRVGRINSDHVLDPAVRRAGAMNPTDCGGLYELSAANANRLGFVTVSPDLDAFIEWNAKQPDPYGMRAKLCAFLKVKPGLAVAVPKDAAAQSGPYPTFRSWDNACKCRTDQARAGLVGSPAYAEFLNWDKLADLPQPEDVLTGKKPLPERSDARFATLIAIASLAARDYKQWGKAAWAIILKVAETKIDEAIVPTRALATAAPTIPVELAKLAPALQRIRS